MVGYIFAILPILLILSAAAAFIMIQLKLSQLQKMADNAVPELRENEDGTYELSWPDLGEAGADYYYVNIGTSALLSENGERTFFSGYVDDMSCYLPELPTEEGLVFEMELIKKYSLLGKERTVKLASIERHFFLRDSVIKKLNWEVDPDVGTAYIYLDYQGADSCSIFVTEENGEKKFLKNVDENSLELNLNEEEGLWMPTPGNSCILTFVPGNHVKGMTIYGGKSKEMIVSWEEFAPRDIQLSLEVRDESVCYLEWSSVNCDFYEIQMRDNDDGVWKSIKTVTREDDCTYVTPKLSPGAGYSFRVAAVMEDYTAVSEVRDCEVAVTPLYCTIWPVRDLKAYSDVANREVAGEVKALDAYCVVDVQNNMFGVYVDGSVCYIDSNYCMINLQEYLGSMCSYDITNSYDSIFMVHGFEIPGLTGTIIKGFENMQLADGSFLVPLLYPTARKLETAIENALEDGYRLKIYEAFRPHDASVYMYQTASKIQHTTLPEYNYWGDDPGPILYTRDTDGNGVVNERRKTYWEMMCGNGNYSLGSFLSAGVSRHNIGVAMDLTLEYVDTRDELLMQTDMHDLSHYSALAQNNEYATQLSKIMRSAGFNGLSSEWWHFQDDDINNKLSLPCMNEGVTAECWMDNGYGQRYRYADGTYAADGTFVIDGIEYTFDSDGFVQN